MYHHNRALSFDPSTLGTALGRLTRPGPVADSHYAQDSGVVSTDCSIHTTRTPGDLFSSSGGFSAPHFTILSPCCLLFFFSQYFSDVLVGDWEAARLICSEGEMCLQLQDSGRCLQFCFKSS